MNALTTSGPIALAIIGGIIVLTATAWSSYQQNILQDKLQDKTEEITQLTTENLNMIKGGDSYPILSPGFVDDSDTILFSLHNNSEFPLFDLDLYISDNTDPNSELFPKKIHFDKIGSGKDKPDIYSTTLPKQLDEKEIFILTSARNGETRQVYECFRSNGNLGVRTKIYRNGELIYSE